MQWWIQTSSQLRWWPSGLKCFGLLSLLCRCSLGWSYTHQSPLQMGGRLNDYCELKECLSWRPWFIMQTFFLLITLIYSHWKEKNIYHINTVLNQEFVNNIKQSPLSGVGIYTTLFCGVCIMDFGNNSHVSSCLFQNESNQLGYVKLKEVSF